MLILQSYHVYRGVHGVCMHVSNLCSTVLISHVYKVLFPQHALTTSNLGNLVRNMYGHKQLFGDLPYACVWIRACFYTQCIEYCLDIYSKTERQKVVCST